jgi:hypothetical protein
MQNKKKKWPLLLAISLFLRISNSITAVDPETTAVIKVAYTEMKISPMAAWASEAML